MADLEELLSNLPPWAEPLAVLAAAVVAALLAHAVLFAVAIRVARRTPWASDESFVRHARGPARLILPLLAVQFLLPALELGEQAAELFSHAVELGLIAALIWLAIALLGVAEDVMLARYQIQVADNLQARRAQTQIRVLKRVANAIVLVIGGSVMLMTFPQVRQLGASLLASAGIAGIVIGMAARPALSNLIAGMQIALAQPIRIDDVVIVEGEWGRIEEITGTYVVVRIWDERRLVVPLSHFIEKPFQNWTRTSAQILGTVFVHADYTVPFDAVRSELERVVRASDLWDRRVCVLQVTDATDHTVQMRALVSAQSSGQAWELRCEVREKLVAFLQREHPGALPRARVELGAPVDGRDLQGAIASRREPGAAEPRAPRLAEDASARGEEAPAQPAQIERERGRP